MASRARSDHGHGVRPLDVDGVRTTAVITVLWAAAFVVLAIRRADLESAGRGWWMWTCLAGVGLGLLGIEYCRKRRDAIARAELEEEADSDLDDITDWRDGELAALAADDDDIGEVGEVGDEASPHRAPADVPHRAPADVPHRAPADVPHPGSANVSHPGSANVPHPGPADLPKRDRPEQAPAGQPSVGQGTPRQTQAQAEAQYFSPAGRPPPGYVTGEFPVPQLDQPPPAQPPPAQPPPVQPPAAPPVQPPAAPPVQSPQPPRVQPPEPADPVGGIATPAGYSPDPERAHRHPRDEELSRRRTEQDDLRSPPPATAASELFSDLLADEPEPRASSGPEFLLDEPDDPQDDRWPDSGEYRGRRARRD